MTGDHRLVLSSLPLDILQEELQRRQDAPAKPACGTTGRRGTYNTGIYVFALFLILGLSTLSQ